MGRFARRFVEVARLGDVPPGGLRRVEVDGHLICLANVEGVIYAVDDDCPHIGGTLSEGTLAGCVLTCPVHLARFDVRDGHVVRGPAREPVPTYAVRVAGDRILVARPDADWGNGADAGDAQESGASGQTWSHRG